MITNSGKTRKKRGLRRSVIIVLCAVLAACTGVAFGGFIAREVSPNPIYAEAAISGAGTSASPYVISGTTAEMAAGWNTAVNASSSSNKVYVKLGSNWTADSSTGNFGSGTNFVSGSISVPAGKNVNLDLNGKTISRGLTAKRAGGQVLTVYGVLDIKSSVGEGIVTGGFGEGGGGVLLSSTHANLTLNSGATISNNQANTGGAVYVTGGANLTLNGGKISENKVYVSGGGVFVANGVFNIKSGTITGNKSISSSNNILGGGVALDSLSAKAIMTGGTISKNEAQKGAGVSMLAGAQFVMNTGTITENVYDVQGGGVWGWHDKISVKFTMTGGTISNNTPISTSGYHAGGGVWMGEYAETEITGGTVSGNVCTNEAGFVAGGKLNMFGGTIRGNKGGYGGVFCGSNTQVNIKGNPKVTGNIATDGITSNFFRNGNILNVVGAFTHTSAGIGMHDAGQITSGYKTYNSSKNPNTVFVSDTSGKEVKLVGNEAVVVTSGTDTSKMVAQPVSVGGLQYTGGSQTIIKGYNSTYMNAPSSITSGASLSGANIVATNAGTYSATFSLKSGYKWTDGTTANKTVSGVISKVSAAVSTFASKTVTYNGKAHSIAAPTATPGTGVTWAVTYKQGSTAVTSPTNAGIYTATATPTYSSSNYHSVATQTATLTINKATLTVTLAYATAPVYGGSAVSPTLTVKLGTANASGYGAVTYSIASTDQGTTAYPGKATINSSTGALTPAKAGKIRVTVSIASSTNFNSATKTVEVTIGAKNIATGGSVASIAAVTYTGAAHTPTPAVTNSSKNAAGTSTTLTKDTDYTLSYSNNTNAGTATVTVTGKGNYTGTLTKTFTINKKALTATSTAANKTYNGNTTATVTLGTVSGIVSGDTVTATAAGTFADKNVGTGKTVTIKYTLSGADAANYSMANKTVTANITKKALTATSTAANKTYNGNTTATITLGTVSGIVSGDTVTATAAGNFADKNVGTDKTVTIKYTLSGTDAANYSMADKTITANITKKALTAASTAANKTYNGNPTATITLGTVTGLVTGDTVTITPAGTFADKNVGNAKNVTITYTLTGTDAGNYSMANKTVTANITQKALTANSTVANKVFNGSAAATVTKGTLSGAVSGDDIDFTAAGTFADKNVGTGKTVTIKYTLSGTDAANYSMADKTVTANITAKDIATDGAISITGSYVYTGAALTPTYTVTNSAKNAAGDSTTLTKDTDYTVIITNNTNAGTATLTVTGKGNYASTISKDFTISKAQITAVKWDNKSASETLGYVYDGTEKQPEITSVTTGNTLESGALPANFDDMFTYGGAQTEKGESYTATATLKGAYANNFEFSSSLASGGDKTKTSRAFKITAAALVLIAGATQAAVVYSGNYDRKKHGAFTALNLKTTSDDDAASLTWYYSLTNNGTDWTTSMPEFTDAGKTTVYYKVTADNHSDYTGSANVVITSKDIGGAGSTLPASLADVYYTGSAITEKNDLIIRVAFGSDGHVLENTESVTEYTLTFTNNKNAGTATITIAGSGNYTGTKSITFEILPVEFASVSATPYGGADGAEFDGAAHAVITSKTANCMATAQASDISSVKWEYSLVGGASATDWTTTMPEATDVADGNTYYYRVSADNHVTKYGSVTVKIIPKDLSSAVINGGAAISDQTYTGSAITPRPSVGVVLGTNASATELVKDADFEYSYSANTAVGTATLTVNGKGNYTGAASVTFNIVNAAITVDKDALGLLVYNATYDGNAHNVIASGFESCATAAGSDTLVWSFSLNGTSDWKNMLQLKDATVGTTVYYKVSGDNHSDATGSFTVVINRKKITSVSGITAESRDYDGTTAATLDYSAAQFPDVCNSDDIKIVSATGTFDGKNAGQRKVFVSDIVLGGDAAANYELALNGEDNANPENAFELAGTVEITKLAVQVKLEWTNAVFTNEKQVPKAIITNKAEGDLIDVVSSVKDNREPVLPDTYVLVISSLTNNNPENYYLANAPLELTFYITTDKTAVRISEESLKHLYDGKAAEPYLEVRKVDEETGDVSWEKLATGELSYTYTVTPEDKLTEVDGKKVPVNAGAYVVTFTINSYTHSWQDTYQNATRTATLVIEKATFGEIEWAGTEGVTASGNNTFTATYNGGNFGVNVSNTLPADVYGNPEITVVYLYDGVAASGRSDANESGYTVTAKFTVSGNYNAIPDSTVKLVINRAVYDLSGAQFADGRTTFDGAVKTIAPASGLPAGVTVSGYEYIQNGASLGSNGVRAVGEYTVRAHLNYDSSNYKLVKDGADYANDYLEATFTVDKQSAEIDVKLENATFTYDGNVHRLLITGTANGIKSVSYTYVNKATGATVGTDGVRNAGAYTVTAHFEIDEANFSGTIEDITAELTINRAPLTVKANDSVIYYGDARSFGGAEMIGLVSGDGAASVGAVTLDSSYRQYDDAATYAIVPEITAANRGANFNNYSITYENGALTVKPRVITVKWYNTSDISGAQDLSYVYAEGVIHTPYAVVSNPVLGDGGLVLKVSGGQENAGFDYVATVENAVYNADGSVNNNYALPANGISVHFDVLPRPKNGVIIWDNSPLYYNGEEQAPKAYYYENENDNSPETLTVTTDRRAVNVGTGYVATVSLGDNYTLTGAKTKTFDILKREVYIEIPDLSVPYGKTPDLSSLEWRYLDGSLGFVDGEVYEITFTCGTVSAVGNYPISGNFTSANAANYDVKFVGGYTKEGDINSGKCGTLTVTASNVDMSKVTFVGTEATYDKNVHTVKAAGLPEGVTATYNYTQNGWSFGSAGVTEAGVYKVIVSFECGDKSYGAIADREITLTIKKAALTVTANDKEIFYGDAPVTNGVTYGAEGVESGLSGTLTLITNYTRYGNVGEYVITPSGLTSDNYEIIFVPGTLTVIPRAVTVSWYTDETATNSSDFNYQFVQGNKYLPYAVVTSGLVNGDYVTVSVSGEATEAGIDYVATVKELLNADGSVNGNYVVTNASRKFSVIPAAYTVVWDNSPLYYTGANLKPAAYYFEEGGNTPVRIPDGNITVSGNHSEVGVKYTATVNYTVGGHVLSGTREYEILPAEVTVTINGAIAVYGAKLGEIALSADRTIDGVTLFVKGYSDTNAVLNAGSYTIGGSYAGSNYKITFVEGTLEITPAEIDEANLALTGDTTVRYDGKPHTLLLAYKGSTENLPEGITVTYKYYKDGKEISSDNVTGAGTYTVEAVITTDGNHKPLTGTYSGTITITATQVTGITFTGATLTYDGNPHNIFVTGNTEGVDKVEYFVGGKPFAGATDAGVYAVTAKITVGENYTIANGELNATLTIGRANLTVKANDGSTVYGTPAKAEGYGYTVSGVKAADNSQAKLAVIIGNVTYGYGVYGNAGKYAGAITIVGGNVQTTNYKITYVAGSLTVTPFIVTSANVNWSANKNFNYVAGTAHSPEATAVNLPDGGLGLKVEGAKEEVGSNYTAYVTAVLNSDGSVNKNYVIDVAGVETQFSVLPVAPDKVGKVVWDNTKLYYNGEEQRPDAWYYADENSDERTRLTVEGGATDVNVNGYTAKVTLNGKTYATTFYIVPRPVIIVIDDVKASYGETPNMGAVGWTYRGDSMHFLGEFSLTFTCGEVNAVGKYPVHGNFNAADAANYDVTFVGSWASADELSGRCGTLTVVKAVYDMGKVTFTGTDTVYDGTAHKLVINGLPEGVTATLSYSLGGFGYGSDGVVNAGRYTVNVVYTGDGNHEPLEGATVTLTVRKAALTVTANPVEITYGEEPAANGVTVGNPSAESQLKGGVTYEFNYQYKDDAGEYLITPSGLTSDNYEITFVPGVLTVTPREISISWFDDERMTSQNFVYGWDDVTVYRPYAHASGLADGDAVILALSEGYMDAGENYVVKVLSINNADGSKNTNYVLPSNGSAQCTFSIMPPAYTVIWDNTPLYYKAGTAQAPSAYYIDAAGVRHEMDVTTKRVAIDVNDYVATARKKDGDTNTIQPSSKEYSILPAPVTVTVNGKTEKYGKALGAIAFSSNADAAIAADVTFSVGGFEPTDIPGAGKYEIAGAYMGTNQYGYSNYDVTFISGELVIEKADYDMSGVTYGGLTAEYDGNLHKVTVNGLPEGVTATVTYSDASTSYGADGVRAAGVYNVHITFAIADGANYNAVADKTDLQITISKKAASVSGIVFNDATFTYDGNVHGLFVTGGTAEGVTEIVYTYTDTATNTTVTANGVINAGTYKVTANFTVDTLNYTGGIAPVEATLVIGKATLTVTANDGSAVYGDALPLNGFGYKVSGLVGNDAESGVLGTVTVGYAAGNYANAGTYANAITVSAANSGADNYEIVTVAGTLLVTPRILTATWQRGENDASADFVYEYVAGGKFIPYAVAGNVVGGDSLVFTVVEEKEGAGDNYVARITGVKNADGSENNNYALPVSGLTQNFTVKYSPDEESDHEYEVVWDYNAPYYDGNAHAPSAKYFNGSVWVTVTNIIVKNAQGDTVTAVNAGKYTAEIGGDTSIFKEGSALTSEFEILPRPVHVQIGDAEIRYGATFIPDETLWSVRDGSLGFVNGDESGLVFTSNGSAVGKYAIYGSFANANYNVTFFGGWAADGDADSGKCGVLEIIKAVYDMSKVTVTGTELVYNGEHRQVSVNNVPAGVTATVTYTADGWSYFSAKNAGTYAVLVTFEGDSNYEAIAPVTATLTISKAKLTVTANDNTVIYGEDPAANGVTFTGFAGADDETVSGVLGGAISYSFNYVKGASAGSNYKITPSGVTSDNYELTFKQGVLTVDKRPVTVSWYKDASLTSQTLSYVYDGLTVFAPFAVAGNLLSGDTVTLTVSGGKSAAGIDYAARVTAINGNGNYRLPDGGAAAKFSVIPGAYEIVWESATFVYNGQRQAPRAFYFDEDGARVELIVTVEGVTDGISIKAGTYLAVASQPAGSSVTLTGNARYSFAIEKLAVTVKINDARSAYLEQIVLGGWECVNGTSFVGGAAPVILGCTAAATSPAGAYAITGRCSDAANYDVTFIDGVYTIEKAVIEAPSIASKQYTGELLVADIADTPQYRVYVNRGGINAGRYDVVLELKDYENYKWQINGQDIRSANCTVTFVIEKAENSFITEFEAREIKVGEEILITAPVAKFGTAQVGYFKDRDCTQPVNTDGNIWNEPQGIYYARVSVSGTDNYYGLDGSDYVYVFAVTGKLTLNLNWSADPLVYNGAAQAPRAYVWINGREVELIVAGAQVKAGNGYTASASLNAVDGTDLSAYVFSEGEGSASNTITFSILPREITVCIEEDRESVYGDRLADISRLGYTIIEGSLLSGDRPGISFTCDFGNSAVTPAGKYAILGVWTDKNYNVTFKGSWDGDDVYNGAAATYTVRKADITVNKSGSEWFDEAGVIDKHNSHFVTLGNEIKNEEGEVTGYSHLSLKGGQKPNVYFSLTLDSYDSAIHDNMTEEDVKAFFDRGIQTTPPEIRQSGNWVVYYRIEAENHNVKYGQWRVLIQASDNYIIVEFVKNFERPYGDTAAGENILGELIDNGVIRLNEKGAVTNIEQLRSIANAYAYEDVSGSEGFAGKTTASGAYPILLSLKPDRWVQEAYGDLVFIYKASSDDPDSNLDRYVITPRKLGISWGECNFTYDGEIHVPSVKLTGLVDGAEQDIALGVGETKEVTLPNGDMIDVTLSLISGNGVVNAGRSTLRLTVNGENYALATDGFVDVNVAQNELDIVWGDKTFVHDGSSHLPTLSINGEEVTYTLTNGVAVIEVVMPNGEKVNVTVRLVGGANTTDAGTYTLQLEVDNANYAINSSQNIASVTIVGEESGVQLPVWAIIAIAAGGAMLLLILIIVIAKRKKKSPAGGYEDEDGFNDVYEE